jgi:Tfp pilus assembly protein FimT
MKHRRRREGFSLWEFVIALFVLGAMAAIAVPTLTTSRRLGRVQSAASLIASELRLRAGRALRGTTVGFSFARDVALSDSLQVNPPVVTPPDNTLRATDLAFEGGSGDTLVGGSPTTASIVVADAQDPSVAYAVVAGRRGAVSIKRFAEGDWKDW